MKPQEILDFYDEFRGKRGWNSLEAIRQFLPQLFAARSFDGFHFFTSHANLCISHFAHYANRDAAPQFSIVPHATELLWFEFTIHRGESPIFRAFTERVICPVERGLEQFDDIFSRFRVAQKPK